MLAQSAKVQGDLKHRFITLAWPEVQNPPCLGMGFRMEWLRLSRPEATHVERELRGGPYAGVA